MIFWNTVYMLILLKQSGNNSRSFSVIDTRYFDSDRILTYFDHDIGFIHRAAKIAKFVKFIENYYSRSSAFSKSCVLIYFE